jgi:protein-tyrosine phosphatase
MYSGPATRLLIVCTGNYCRSPMAEAILRHRVRASGREREIAVESAGTRPFCVGGSAHPAVLEVLRARGIVPGELRCRGLDAVDLPSFDRVLAADRHVLRRLEALDVGEARLELLASHARSPRDDVPDPFLDGGFEGVFELIDDACRGLIEKVLDERARRSS